MRTDAPCADRFSSAYSIRAVPVTRFNAYFPAVAARALTIPFSMISAIAGKSCCAAVGTGFHCRSGA
jgi:hypothetical protein